MALHGACCLSRIRADCAETELALAVVAMSLYGPDRKFIRPNHIVLHRLLWHALSEAAPNEYRELLVKVANIS